MMAEGLIDPNHFYGTINCNGVNAKGEICGVTTTSGLAWKIPGRVGDSPILGAGLYVDGAVGAAGSTGRGEANLFSLASFLIVDEMRRGKAPKDAGMEALRRITANQIEKRLLNARGEPNFNISFYVLNAKGEYAGRHDVQPRQTGVRRLRRQGPAAGADGAAASRRAGVGPQVRGPHVRGPHVRGFRWAAGIRGAYGFDAAAGGTVSVMLCFASAVESVCNFLSSACASSSAFGTSVLARL